MVGIHHLANNESGHVDIDRLFSNIEYLTQMFHGEIVEMLEDGHASAFVLQLGEMGKMVFQFVGILCLQDT